jgi:dCMP deaminase
MPPNHNKSSLTLREYSNDLEFMDESFISRDLWRLRKEGNVFMLETSPEFTQKDLIYIRIANLWSENSKCERMKVGSIIVKDKSIISDGYNGTPSGFPDICESDCNVTLPSVLHAEANAITKLARSTQSSDGSTMYVTLSPCYECSKLIIQSGIRKVVFSEIYRKPESLAFLAEAGIELLRINLEKYAK